MWLEYCRACSVASSGWCCAGVGDNKTYVYTCVGIDGKSLLNESSDCLLTNCCVHLFHDLIVLGKKECL